MTRPPDVLVVSGADTRRVMTPSDWFDAADLAFRAARGGTSTSPRPLHVPMTGGGLHAKAASITLDRPFVAVKVNSNFPDNPAAFGLPTVQGAVLLADASNGVLLAILDSVELTLRRTAAASALAARLLARQDSATLLVCGCGAQGRAHVEALRHVLPLERLLFWDRNPQAAEALARDRDGVAVMDLAEASSAADVIICCTSAREPYLAAGMVKPGAFIAATGADNPAKSEIAPALLAEAKVVTDVLAQCAAMGDLHHAIAAGLMSEANVHSDLARILVGDSEGRTSRDEFIIFDSTGTGLQDVAAAATIYERCVALGLGQAIDLS